MLYFSELFFTNIFYPPPPPFYNINQEENVQLWYDLFNWTQTMANAKGIMIENCHNVRQVFLLPFYPPRN